MDFFKETQNNFMCPHQVVEDTKFQKLPLSAKYLYIILCKLANRYADKEGFFFRSIDQLCIDSGLSNKTIVNAKQILKKNAFIDIKVGRFEHSKQRTYDFFKLNGFRFKK